MWWDFENRKVYGRQSWFKEHWKLIAIGICSLVCFGLMIVSEYFGDV